MNNLGLHVLMEFHNCDEHLLNDSTYLELKLNEAAELARATIIKSVFHQFSPHGVTGVIVVAESHLSIHTWPEHKYAAVDFFTCNEQMDYNAAYTFLGKALQSTTNDLKTIKRGMLSTQDQANTIITQTT